MKLGIIGGLGPLASVYFYELLTKMSDVNYDQGHLEIILHSCPSIPDRTEYILDHTKDNPVPKLIEIGKELESLGVDYIAMPCITAHYFHDDLAASISVPIIHLIQELKVYLLSHHIHKVGIMATTGTITTNLFQNELLHSGIECVIPHHQNEVMHIIYQNVKKGTEIDMDVFHIVSQELFDMGSEIIILGCTELSIVKKEHDLDERYLDMMELLSAVALYDCHMKVKETYQYLLEGRKTCRQMY
ncbi:MAG: amino acid racemase [Erysipelotrichaceae bacterium]|nr:amino acid racemase [Erysipelotrichaceae bacterium]